MATRPATALKRLRKICLDLPEAVEQETWGHPTFRVREKIFASFGERDGRSCTTLKTVSEADREFVLARSDSFVPKYVGHKGWVGLFLDGEVDWDLVDELVVKSYGKTAPKKLARLIVEDRGPVE